MRGHIVFDIREYWHAGAGHGVGRFIDSAVRRTPAGLPFIPGRTVKGLLRKAMQEAEGFGHLRAGLTEELFGSVLGTDRFETEPGTVYFGNAELPDGWEEFAHTKEGKQAISGFFETISSTAIDQEGQAKEGSLRRVEVAIPLTLYGTWEFGSVENQQEARDALEMAAKLIRGFGLSRTRGLGRVKVWLEESTRRQN